MCEVADADTEVNTDTGGKSEGESEGECENEGENENEGEDEGEGEGEGESLIKTLGCVEVLGTYVDESEIGGDVRTVSDDVVVVVLCRLSVMTSAEVKPGPPSRVGGSSSGVENTAFEQYRSKEAR